MRLPADPDYCDRDEALTRLGIKRSTLYTYVSRGWIKSVPVPGTRSHLFSREDVERVRARGLAHVGETSASETALRWGAPIIATRITKITPQGPQYRGHDVLKLAETCAFEAVAELLWSGVLSDRPVLWDDTRPARGRGGAARRDAAGHVTKALAAGVLALATDTVTRSSQAPAIAAREIVFAMLDTCGEVFRQRQSRQPAGSIATRLARALGIAPSPPAVRALDCALILSADLELTPAALVARIAASTGADLYASVAAGICAHGGVQTGGGGDRIEALLGLHPTRKELKRHLQTVRYDGARRFGLNYPLYPTGDPRAWMLIKLAERLSPHGPAANLAWFVHEAANTHRSYPGLGISLVTLSRALGLPKGSATAIWTLGRAAGIVAHIIEQQFDGYVLRARARYVG